MKTVIGFFDNETAKRVSAELAAEKFTNVQQRTKVRLGTQQELLDLGIPAAEAKLYTDELQHGGTLVTVDASDEKAPRAIEIMRRGGARNFKAHFARLEADGAIPIVEERLQICKQDVDLGGVRIHPRLVATPVEKEVVLREEHVGVDRRRVERPATESDYEDREISMMERAEQAYATKTAHVVEEIRLGKTVSERTETIRDTLRHTEVELRDLPGESPDGPAKQQQAAMPAGTPQRDHINVIQEELEVAKRAVERGGRAVRSHVVATPVEQQVALRDEHVNVERRRVDRPATNADYESPDLTMSEHTEQPFATKTASVVEEIRLEKSIEEHKEKFRDSVRHTEVDVEDVRAMRRWDLFSKDYKTHFEKAYGSKGGTWEQYEPAYRLGHEYGYGGREWNTIENDAKDRWEKANPGTWARVKDAVRAAYDKAKAAVGVGAERHA